MNRFLLVGKKIKANQRNVCTNIMLSCLLIIFSQIAKANNDPVTGHSKKTTSNATLLATNTSYTTAGTFSFTVPAGVFSIRAQAWGGGGKGSTRTTAGVGGAGGGGAYSMTTYEVSPGQVFTVTVGAGSSTTANGGNSWISPSTLEANAFVNAIGGVSKANNSATGAAGGSAASGVGSTKYSGGTGGAGSGTSGGGGGSSAGTNINGNNGGTPTAGAAPTGGGAGGVGRSGTVGVGVAGSAPGGGGGGAYSTSTTTTNGGSGGTGKIIINYEVCAANAGNNISRCDNGPFSISGNAPASAQTGTWSVVSGNANIASPSSQSTTATLTSGRTATLRWTIVGVECTSIDDIFISNDAITSNAGVDQTQCYNSAFTVVGNTPSVGQSVLWSVVSGTPLYQQALNNPSLDITTAAGTAATLRYTVSGSTFLTTHLNPSAEGGFESGSTFSSNGWVAVNHSINNWFLGAASTPSAGSRAAYISNNRGTTHAYTNTAAQTSHIYKTVNIASGNTDITLSFKWKCSGESGYDRILVYTAPTSITPVAGTPASAATAISGATLVSGLNLHSSAGYQTATFTLPNSLAGTFFRLIFTFQNDGSGGINPPPSIDEVSLISTGTGTCSAFDDVVITNTTACTPSCVSPINLNGDLEDEGTATNFNLSFQGTPAQLITAANAVPNWGEGYGSAVPNTTSFYGAYYLKKTGAQGNPRSGTHMVYIGGAAGYCLLSLNTVSNLSCGKKYKFSAWIAAYSNTTTQSAAPFAMEYSAGGDATPPTQLSPKIELVAPASTSWNNLNWQRYEFILTLPENGFTWSNFILTPYDNVHGIVVDDVCITEIEQGSSSFAGNDIYACSATSTMAANTAAAGYTGTWSVDSGTATIASPNSPTSSITITSGSTTTLNWTVSNGTCTSTDKVVISYISAPPVTVNNASICSGSSATLTATGCSGNLLWSNGATTSSITVSPSSTTSYSVTCTPTLSSNLVLNPGFESATNFQNWGDWGSSGITTVAEEVRTGSKAAKINALTGWSGFGQDIVIAPGDQVTCSFWAKSNSPIITADIGIQFVNSSYVLVDYQIQARILSQTWQKYTVTGIAPVGSAYIQPFAFSYDVGTVFIDDVEMYKSTGCTSIATGTVTVGSDPITLSTPTVSSCINQPLQDVATVSITASWVTAPAGAKLKITYNNKTEYIDVAGGAVSPQTVVFNVPAVSSSGNTILASWATGSTCSKTSNSFTIPGPCSSDNVTCNILYLCGSDKPYDGEPFDKGLMQYIDLISTGTFSGALTKPDGTGYGLYDIASPSTLLSINLDNYKLIIISPTTQGDLAPDLIFALNAYKGGILNMNYDAQTELNYTYGSETYSYQTQVYTDNTTAMEFLNYDNPGYLNNNVVTAGNYNSPATASLWFDANDQNARINGVYYKYGAHSNSALSKTHGPRVFFGLHMNGLYANTSNGGALPAPVSSYFAPTKHLTLQGKAYLDQAILDASLCNTEICTNGIDDDGDGLVDCVDPDCNFFSNGEFDNGTTTWNLYVQSGNTATLSVDGSQQLRGLNSAKVETTTTSGTDWHVQLAETGNSIVAGKTYTVSFLAKASASRNITVPVQLGSSPFTNYSFNTFALTTVPQEFSFDFIASATIASNISLLFNLGSVTGTVWIDDVEFKESCANMCGSDCIGGNLIVNGSLTTDLSGWTATNGQLSLGFGGPFGNYMIVNNSDLAGTYSVYQDVAIGANKPFLFRGLVAKHASSVNAKVYLEFYNGTTYLSKTSDFIVLRDFDGIFQIITPISGTTPSSTTKIRVVAWCNGTAIKLDELSLVTCDPRPAITGTTPGSRCGTGTVTLGATTGAGTINWYNVATGGTSLGTGTSFTTPSISSTTTYYVDATNGTCTTSTRTAVVATVSGSAPTITGTTPASRCGTGTVTLGATASTGTINWYAASTGGASLGTGISFTTPSISSTTTYYVDATSGSCTTASRTAVTATVNTLPSITTTTPASRCGTGTLTLGATASAGTINWYAASSGGASLGTGTSFTTPSISVTTTYYVDVINGGCTSTPRVAVVATITPAITISSQVNSSSDDGEEDLSNGVVDLVSSDLELAIDLAKNQMVGMRFTNINIPKNAIITNAYIEFETDVAWNTSTALNIQGENVDDANTFTTVASNISSRPKTSLSVTWNPVAAWNVVDEKQNSPDIKMIIQQIVNRTGWVSSNDIALFITGSGTREAESFDGENPAAPKLYITYHPCLSPEACSNGIDDDGDGWTDSVDPNCPQNQTCACTGTNKFSNPGFESGTFVGSGIFIPGVSGDDLGLNWGPPSGLSGWSHGPLWWVQSNKASEGNRMVYINNTSGGAVCQGQYYNLGSASTEISPCATYQICFDWASFNRAFPDGRNTTSQPGIDFLWLDGSGNSLGGSHVDIGTPVANQDFDNLIWTKVSYQFSLTGSLTPPVGAVQVRVNLSELEGQNNGVLIDNANLCVIMAEPSILTTTPASRCGTGTVTLGATASAGTINWYAAATGGASLGTGTSFTTPSIAITTTYYVDNTNNGCTSASRTPVIATINSIPTISTTSPASRCGTGTVTLGATASAGTINWYAASTGGASLGTGTSYTTPSIATTTTYYVDATAVGCTTISRTAVTATIVAIPSVVTTTPASRCGTGTVTLGATASAGTLNWYAASTGGASLGTGTSFTTPSISATTTYYVDATDFGCITASRTAVIATVNTIPSVATSTPASRCGTGTVTLGATASSGTINWYAASTGGASLGTGTSFTTPSISVTTIYYVDATNLGCITATRTAVTATINPIPSVTITGASAVCIGATTTLSPTTGGTWASSNAAVATVTNGGIVTGVAAGTATFTFTNTSTTCVSLATSAITVNAKPSALITGSAFICIGATTTLSPTTGGTWTSSNTAVATVSSSGVVTSVSAGTATFTFTQSSTGCISDATGIVTIYAKPTVSITGSSSICVGATTTLSPSSGGVWVSSNTAVATVTNGGIVTGVGAGTATFTFTQSSTTCVSLATAAITVTAIPSVTTTTPASRCGTGTVTLGATASAGTINWYAASTGGASLGTGTSFTTPSISATTIYYVDATDLGCITASRTAVTATINAIPIVATTTPASRCGTGTVTLGATASAGTINWYAAATGGASLGTGNSFTTPSISSTTTYYVDATDLGCITASRTAVIATILPTLSLGNRVWTETDNDGIFEPANGDLGTDGVLINLFNDVNGDNVLTVADGASIASQVTFSGGQYMFRNLCAGNYIVQVAVSNFNAGGPLENLQSTTGNGLAPSPNDNVDNDDNGDLLAGFGVVSSAITLSVAGEPTNDGDSNNNTNWTLDFGFYCSFSTLITAIVSNNNADKVNQYTYPTGSAMADFVTVGSGSLSRPYDFTFGPEGDLFVVGGFSDAVHRYDNQIGTSISTFVPALSGGLDEPRGLTFGPDGNLYVTSFNTNHVKRYNGSTGAFIDNFISTNLNGPHQGIIFAPDGNLYVSNYTGNNIAKYNGETGAFIASVAITTPRGIVLGPDGNLYVTNHTNVINKLTLSTFTLSTYFTGGSEYYGGINFGPDGKIYVTDLSNNRIKKVDYPTGADLGIFINTGGLGEPKDILFNYRCCNTSAPTVTSGSRCGSGSITLSASGCSGGTLNWYAAATGGASLGTGTSYTTPSISSTTIYYVECTIAGCPSTRTAVTATINSIPAISGTTGASRCGTGTVTLGAAASAGTINWYAALTGGTSLGTGTSFTTPSISATTTYYVDATDLGCITASRTAVIATITAIPSVATTTPASRCGSGTVTLGATASSGTINWYAASTGGASLGTGTSFTTPTISSTTTYYVDATDLGCITASRMAVIATINAIPSVATTTPASRCGTGTVTLGATASSGTINWYAASTGGASLGAGNSFTTPSISSTTTYYVDATDLGCITASRTAVTASVNSFASITSTTPSSRCGTGTVTLGATASSGIINWYAALTGGASLGSGTSFTTPSITTTTTYYVDATDMGCITASRTAVTATINDIPSIATTTPASRCGTGTLTLGATASAGTINWYAASTGGASLGTGISFTTPSISTTTTYYVDATDLGCITASRTAVTATINALPSVATITPASRCGMGTVTLGATASSGTINWYAASTGGASLGAGNSFTTPSISSTTTYYVDATDLGCITATRTAVTATVNALPVVNITSTNLICGGITLDASGGGTYLWNNAQTTQSITVNPDFNTNYTVTVTDIIGCTATASKVVATNFGPTANACLDFPSGRAPCFGTIEICEGNLAGLRGKADGNGPFTFFWSNIGVYGANHDILLTADGLITKNYTFDLIVTDVNGCTATSSATVLVHSNPSASINGIGVICIAESVTLTSGFAENYFWSTGATTSSIEVSPVVTTTYTITVTNDFGCTSVANKTIIVNTSLSVASTTPASRCGTGTVTLGATPSAGTINWYADPTGGASLGTGTSFTTPSLSSTTTYYVDATDLGCITTSRTAVTATINAIPSVATATPASRCGTGTVTLGATASAGTINWYAVSTGGASLGTGTSFTTPSISTTTTYYVDATDLGCITGSRTAVIATINPIPVVSITGPNNICILSTSSVSPTSGGTWISSNSAVATVDNSGIVTAISAGTATFTFTNTTTGCVSNATSNITVDNKTSVSITGPNIVCLGSTITLNASSGGGTWSSSNNAVATINNSGVVTSVSSGSVIITYAHNSGACNNDATFALNVNVVPTISGTTPANRCGTGTVTLGATASAGIINWYATSTGGTSLGAGTSYTTPSIASTTTYYVDATDMGCTTASRTAVIATINTIPSVATTTPAIRCGTGTVTLGATSSAGTINWYADPTGGASLGTGTSFTTPSITSTTTYYVDATDLGCITASRTAVTATINAIPSVATATPASRCGTGTVTLGATASTGTINWYAASTGGASLGTGTSFTTPSISTTTTYYVDATDLGCITASRSAVTATVNTIPSVATVSPASRCGTGAVTLGATASAGTINWYASSTGGVSLGAGNSFTTPSISSTTTYYVDATDLGCITASRTAVDATIIDLPIVSIMGPDNICIGTTTTLSPSTGGTWTSSNSAVATVANDGTVTGVSAGTATFTFTNSATNCISLATLSVTVNANPAAIITGSAFLCLGATTTLSPTTGGTWTSSNPAIATITSSGLVTSLTAGTVRFTYTETSTGCISPLSGVITIYAKPIVSITGTAAICIGATTTLSPSTGGTWSSSNNAIASVDNSGIVTGVSVGTATFTFTNTSTGCISNASAIVTVGPSLSSGISYESLCLKDNTHLTGVPTGGTGPYSYNWTGPNGFTAAIETIAITDNGNYYLTITDNYGCMSNTNGFVYQRYEPFIVSLQTQICEGQTVNLAVSGINAVSYLWGPSASNATTAVVTVMPAPPSTTYNVTVTNDLGCTAVASATILVDPKPVASISGINTLCSGTSAVLTASATGTYLWSNNETTAAITVNPTSTTTYTVTITNIEGCTATAQHTINVNPAPPAVINGNGSICPGGNTILTASGGSSYLWNNGSTTAAINVNPASTTSYTVTVTGALSCTSTATRTVIVNSVPVVSITGNSAICIGGTTTLSPSSGGTWLSSNPLVASVNNSGLVSGISAGTATFIFTNTATSCVSLSTSAITVGPSLGSAIDYNGSVCLTNSGQLTGLPTGGTSPFTYSWAGPSGFVGGVQTVGISNNGTYYLTISDSYGCVSTTTGFVYEQYNPLIVTSQTRVCEGQNTLLTVNGTNAVSYLWSSAASNASTQAVTVTPVFPGTTYNVTVTNNLGCSGVATVDIGVDAKPIISLIGANAICVGATTILSPSTGGTWVSNNPSIASISTSGVATGLSAGTATFSFTSSITGCTSDVSTTITVGPSLSASINYNGSLCLSDNSQLTAVNTGGTGPFTYNWQGPSGFFGSIQTVGITNNGNYYLTITDSYGCVSTTSGFVYQRFDPFVINLQTQVCEGSSNLLTASGTSLVSYLWSSSAGNATTQAVTVFPSYPSSTYSVTVTNNIGCTNVATSTISVNQKPIITISGPNAICIGSTTNLLPASGGIWTSSNPFIATITNAGLVTAISGGTATFVFTDGVTGCASNASAPITVHPIIATGHNGSPAICVGNTTNLTPASGGTWVSSHPAIATVTNGGVVTGITQGIAYFTFTSSTTGCVSNGLLSVSVNNKPSILLSGENQICIGSTTNFQPSVGGTWVSSQPSVASISNAGLVTGISAGTATFVFTETSSGCSSNSSEQITVLSRPIVAVTGPQSVCTGFTTTLSPTSGGFWTSNNSTVASVTNAGLVLGLYPGQATFTFTSTSTSCASLATSPITVFARPIVSVTGPVTLCIGSSTTLSPATGGTWVSNNPAVATVTNAGIVTAVAAGNTSFIFTNSTTGCVSNNTASITVFSKPIANISGVSTICLGSNTSLSPASGGTWTSNNPSIASVSNVNLVTGLATGSATFTFVEASTGCVSDPTTAVTVVAKPAVSISGSNNICVGTTTTLSPSTGGTWTSSNTAVASVTNAGIVTGLTNGVVNFTYTSNLGCVSDPTLNLTINGRPTVSINGNSSLCIGTTTNVLPSSGGSWLSSNSGIATVNNAGLVTAISAGRAKFVFTTSGLGCKSDSTAAITVLPVPEVSISGPSAICIGSTAQLFPSVGGVWVSNNTSVATVNNSGLVTALTSGTASFTFTLLSTGCTSIQSITITVNPKPVVGFTGSLNVCSGSTTTLFPTSGGVWTSANPLIAIVSSSGIVTGVGQGTTKFKFTNSATGCFASTTASVVINSLPSINISGPDVICTGSSSSLLPASGGTWASLNSGIATVTNGGLIQGMSPGVATFVYTESTNGCISAPSLPITVTAPVNVGISGPSDICLGYTTQLSPATGGIWASSDPKIATVTNSGLVMAIAPGRVSFSYTENNTGCISTLPNNAVTIMSCLDPDFNVTRVNVQIIGNVKTNDDNNISAIYGNNTSLLSKPLGSIGTLVVNTDGSYTFTGSMAGKYHYLVPVCIGSTDFGCPSSELIISVLDIDNNVNNMVANVDFVTTYAINNTVPGVPVVLKTLVNDGCVNQLDRIPDPTSVTIVTAPKKGDVVINSNGTITYTPQIGKIGQDTLIYRICGTTEATNCITGRQIITTNAPSAVNSTVADDDFYIIQEGETLTDNVLANDMDAEGDIQTVIPQGSPGVPVIISSGSYYITSDGNIVFNPANNFTGPTELVYTVCDNHVPSVCTKATVHILVMHDIELKIRVYLEGALKDNNNEVAADGRPLMRDNLRVNLFTGANYIPLTAPYKQSSLFVDIAGQFTKEEPANNALANNVIADSVTVFNVSGQNAIVDWVFVELRSKYDYTHLISTRSALVQRDGDVVDVDGISPLRFPTISVDSFYVVIKHRNHLGVMSMKVSNSDLLDFTKASTQVFSYGNTLNNTYNYTNLSQNSNAEYGYNALWAGDFDADGKIKFENPFDDQNMLLFDVFAYPTNLTNVINFNFGYGYLQGDFNMDGKSKYDNPNDDKNLLYGQVLLYPQNVLFLSNFDHFIEQVPNITPR